MQKDILIISVLFHPIQLMMFNSRNRYTVLANLIRNVHDEVLGENISSQDAESFLPQNGRLHDRLRLIGIIQSCAATAFVLALIAMITTYFVECAICIMLFLGFISLLMISMLMFTRRVQLANPALDVHMSAFEQDQEWHQYLKPQRWARKKNK